MIPRKKAVAVSLLLVGGSLKCGYGDFGYEVIWKNIRQTMRKVAKDPLRKAILPLSFSSFSPFFWFLVER